MRILVLSQYWYPENGVPQRRWTWLSELLTEAGHEVTVIAPPAHYERQIAVRQWLSQRAVRRESVAERGPSGETIFRSGFFPAGRSLTQRAINQAVVAFGGVWAVLRRRGSLRDYRPDLIIGTVPALPTAATTRVVAWLLRAPYLIDLRDAWPDLLQHSHQWNKGTGKTSVREKVLAKGPLQVVITITKRVLILSLRQAAGISMTSSYLKDEMQRRAEYGGGEVSASMMTIRNVFPPETSFRARPNLDGPADRLNVLYAGTLGRAQNLGNAIKAAELAKQQGVDVSIRFVGAGAARPMLQELAADCSSNITIEPRQPAGELDDVYGWADTGLVHLTDWEPLSRAVPSKTYELMSAGMHISAVVEGETAELIQKLNAGDVVQPEKPQQLANLWVELAQDRRRLCISGEGAAWVERERTEVVPKRLFELIERATQ